MQAGKRKYTKPTAPYRPREMKITPDIFMDVDTHVKWAWVRAEGDGYRLKINEAKAMRDWLNRYVDWYDTHKGGWS